MRPMACVVLYAVPDIDWYQMLIGKLSRNGHLGINPSIEEISSNTDVQCKANLRCLSQLKEAGLESCWGSYWLLKSTCCFPVAQQPRKEENAGNEACMFYCTSSLFL